MIKITVAGVDKTAYLNDTLAQASSERRKKLAARGRDDIADLIERQEHILALRDCVSEREFLKQLFWLMQTAPQTHTGAFDVPGHRGWTGRMLIFARKCLWRIFRYQHDRMAFQQNAVNQQLTSAIRYLEHLHTREMEEASLQIKDISARLEKLEKNKGEPTT